MQTKFYQSDIKSGFSVFLLALPLCLGIAMASNFPPIAGIITAVIGGLLSSFCGSSRLTIKGPAAGLIVIVVGAVQELGQGDVFLGYKRALATIAVAAIIQIIFAILKAGKIGEIMPPSVVHGMLAAIGVIIISKQTHVLLGVNPTAGTPLQLLAEIPNSFRNLNPEIFLIGLLSILIVALWPRLRFPQVRALPATLVVLLIAIPLSLFFHLNEAHTYDLFGYTFQVGPKFLISLPPSILGAPNFPDFSAVTSAVSIKYIIMFALVGSIESILTVIAVDGIDPEKKPSDLNKDLFATGIGNLIASLLGGLPMISEIVRSRANIDYGARTTWSIFFHGLFLLLSVAIFPIILQKIPLSALAALLVFTGFRLASPHEFKKIYGIGVDQVFLFASTMIVTLFTDLLIGVGVGIILKVLLHLIRGVKPAEFFKVAVDRRQEVKTDGTYTRFDLKGSLVFTNFLRLKKLIESEMIDGRYVLLDVSGCHFIDHTIMNKLYVIQGIYGKEKIELTGLESTMSMGAAPYSLRMRKG